LFYYCNNITSGKLEISGKMEKIDEMDNKYLNSFTEKEKKAFEIAKQHLATSFDLSKSNGFNEWKKKGGSTTK